MQKSLFYNFDVLNFVKNNIANNYVLASLDISGYFKDSTEISV